MKLFYKLLLNFLLGGFMLAAHAQTNCCNSSFSSYLISESSGMKTYRFLMHDSTAMDVESILWSFGDGTTTTERTPSYVYNSSGDYYVTLTVLKQTVNGVQKSCSETHMVRIRLTCANFTYYKSNLNVSFYVYNLDSSKAVSKGFFWTFGDGQTSNELTPTHSYKQAGSYTICLYQYRKDSISADSCYRCQTFIVQDSISPVICRPDFSYTLTDTLVNLHANSTIGTSYWWIEGDTNLHAWGNDVRFALSSKDSFTVCHRQYTDSIVFPNSVYCTECNVIWSTPHLDTIPTHCNSDFTYALTGSTLALNGINSAQFSYWWYYADGVRSGNNYGGDTTMLVPSNGQLTVCHTQYNNDLTDTCIICKIIRERQDTIPKVCYSDFDYTVNGLTITAYSNAVTNYEKNVWHFENKPAVYDTLLANHTFNALGMKRICQTTFTTGSVDSCTTCKDILIEEAGVTIHPNPAVTHIIVKSKEGLISSIDVYDINGTLVKNISELSVIKYNVNVADLTSGIYYVSTIFQDGRVNRTKIIIQ